MGLKKAIATFTNKQGETVTRILTIKSVIFNYAEGHVDTIYVGYPSTEAQTRGAEPTYYTQRVDVDPNNNSEMGLILAVSDALWAKNVTEPFISDYSSLDGEGKQIQTLKSLQELWAKVVDA